MRIKITKEGREKLAEMRAFKPPPVPLPPASAKISVKQVAEILSVDPSIVRSFFVTTNDHKKYPAKAPLPVVLSMPNHMVYFEEAMLMVWLGANYPGFKEYYYVRKQRWLEERARR